MDVPPIISARKHDRSLRLNEAILRSSAAVVFGLIAFWFPLWRARQDVSNSEALAPVLTFGILFVGLFTLLAGQSLLYARRAPPSSTGWSHSLVAAALLLVGSLPLVFLLFRVAVLALGSLTRPFLL